VPLFVVDWAIGASGAQAPEVLLGMLNRAWAERQPAFPVVAAGDTCGIDGC
jgi:predicted DsbA family dithiol-disulfide isomerase